MRWAPPDSEQLFMDYLESKMSIPWGMKAARTSEFGKVLRTGGPRATPVSDQPQLTFEVYAALPSRAWSLTAEAIGYMHDTVGTKVPAAVVYSVRELAGPGLLPDPLFENLTRYSFTLVVQLRANFTS